MNESEKLKKIQKIVDDMRRGEKLTGQPDYRFGMYLIEEILNE